MTVTKENIPKGSDEVYRAGETAIVTVTVDTPLEPDEFNSSDIEFTLARHHGTDPIIHKTDDGPHVNVIDRDAGEVEVKVTKNDTDGLGERNGFDYNYEIVVQTPTNDRAHVTTGTWTIHPSSTPLP